MTCHHRPRAPSILKARRSCLYMAPRARHLAGSMPSSNAKANKTAWGMRSKHLIVDIHPHGRPSTEATQLQQDLCYRRSIDGTLGWAEAKGRHVNPGHVPRNGIPQAHVLPEAVDHGQARKRAPSLGMRPSARRAGHLPRCSTSRALSAMFCPFCPWYLVFVPVCFAYFAKES